MSRRVTRASQKRAHDEEEEQSYFDRITAFQNRNEEFVKVVAKAVGASNGAMLDDDEPIPDGGWEAKVVQMLGQGFYPNGLVEFTEDLYSPLHHAVVHDRLSIVRILLAHGADSNLSSSFGDVDTFPLHDVISEQICQLLLEAGADVDAIGAGGSTALMMAAARGNSRIAHMLLAAGADPTIHDTIGFPGAFSGGEYPIIGETAAKTARRCGHLSLAADLDAAERSHAKPWVEPGSEQHTTENWLQQIHENRARLERRIKEYPPPPETTKAA